MNTSFYTLTLTIENPEGLYPKVWICFRNKFKTFYRNKTQDSTSELKGLQYIVQYVKNKKYNIFVSKSNEFLLKIQKATADLISEAEEKESDALKHYFTIGKIVNPSN
jgi:hypothetical protein